MVQTASKPSRLPCYALFHIFLPSILSLHPYYAFLLQSLVPYSITSQSSVPGVDGEYNTPSGSHFFRIFSSLEYTSFPQK